MVSAIKHRFGQGPVQRGRSRLSLNLVRSFPYPDAGTPNLRSPARYLLWLAQQHKATLALAIFYGTVWMLAQAFVPFALGKAIDHGIVAANFGALALWVGVLVGLTVIQSGSAVMRHRASVSNWLQAAYRSAQLVGYKVTRSGDALPRNLSTGEVVSTSASDSFRIGEIYDVAARLFGSIIGYLVVSVLVAQTSWVLGLVVLLGVPASGALLLFVIRPLQARQRAQREAAGRMTAVGADTVAGLRVLRGIGGEDIFVSRYRERSRTTQLTGNRVATSLAALDAAQVFITGVFTVLFTWLGALMVLDGRIEPGQLVALFGYAVFLVSPIRTASDAVSRFIRAHVGARKIITVLSTESAVHDDDVVPGPPAGSSLADTATGVSIRPGEMTALVCADPAVTAGLAARLGRFDDDELKRSAVRWGAVPLRRVDLREIRRRIVVSEADPQLFTGTLRAELDPAHRHTDASILAALEAAGAGDILAGVDDGLDHQVTERGRAFSGGQRQRLVLARALLTEAEVLVLVEPTSAVDAHTESRIAARLKAARRRPSAVGAVSGHPPGNGAGDTGSGDTEPERTTVLVTASPLLLSAADRVVFLADGRFAADGCHQELMAANPGYRKVVIRSE